MKGNEDKGKCLRNFYKCKGRRMRELGKWEKKKSEKGRTMTESNKKDEYRDTHPESGTGVVVSDIQFLSAGCAVQKG